MNKIYKVVWSKAKHCYVVTSELAKRQTKGCGARSLRMATVSLGVAASLLCSGAVLPVFGESVAEAAVTVTDAANPTTSAGIVEYPLESTLGFKVYTTNSTDKEVNITGSTDNSKSAKNGFVGVFEMASSTASPKGKVNLNNGVTVGAMIGGGSYSGDVANNAVKVTGGTVDIGMFGGFAFNGNATGNAIEISGNSTVINSNPVGSNNDYSKVIGGSGKTGASNNTVTIKGGTINSTVHGGYSENGIAGGSTAAEGNKVIMTGGKVNNYKNIYGGYSKNSNAIFNEVTISGGEVLNSTVIGGFGSSTGTGEASRNTVTVSKGTVEGTVKGGAAGNTTNYNIVTISGGKVTSVVGADNYGQGENPLASFNEVTIKETAQVTNDVYGAKWGYGSSTIEDNTVTIDGSAVVGGNVFGGDSRYRDETRNKVYIKNDGSVTGDVYGARLYGSSSDKGNIKSNEVHISNNAKITGSVYGGSIVLGTGDVKGNIVEVTGGTINEGNNEGKYVYGGYSIYNSVGGTGEGNKVIIRGGQVNSTVVGGFSSNEASIGNSVEILGGEATSTVYGGYSANDAVTGNSVEITGKGKVSRTVYGGYSTSGTAGGEGTNDGNKVIVSGGEAQDGVTGGYSVSGAATGNSVEISGGKVGLSTEATSYINGGYSNKNVATGNKVSISNGSLGENYAVQIFGGYSGSGAADTNEVNLSGGTIGNYSKVSYVYGGWGSKTSASGNTVKITDGTLKGGVVTGGFTYNGTADSNIIKMSGGTLSNTSITGGKGSTSASGNKVTISGGQSGTVYGGVRSAGTPTVNQNEVTIKGKDTVVSEVYGGYGGAETNGNKVLIEESTVNNNVYGGDIDITDTTMKAQNNEVTVKGATVKGSIYGGSSYGTATGNIVTVNGGTFSSNQKIYGGIYCGSTDSGTTTDNIINLTGSTTGLEGVEVYGGSQSANTGNELHVGGTKTYDGSGNLVTSVGDAWQGSSDNTVKTVANFETIALHSVAWNPDVAALAATTVDNIGTLDIKDMQFDKTPSNGESMALLKAENDLGASGVGIGLAYKDGSTEKTATSAELAAGVTFDSGALVDTPVNGVTVTGTQDKKVSLENSNKEIRYSFSSTITGITIATKTFTSGGTARKFGNGDNLTGAKYTNNLAFTDASKKTMESGQSMVILDATEAVAVGGVTLPALTATYKEIFNDAISGKVVTLSGTHTDTLNSDSTKLVYSVGNKEVSDAVFDGKVDFAKDSKYYEADAQYKFNGTTEVNADKLAFNETTEALVKGNKMTLLSADGLSANVTKQPTNADIAVNYTDAQGIKMTATATGEVKAASNAVDYEVTGVTMKSVDLAGWDGENASEVPTGWTLAGDATIETDGMKAPTVETGKVDIITSGTEGYFAGATINGENKYQESSFDETDKGIKFKVKQEKGVKADGKNLVYAAGAKNVDTATMSGEIKWDTENAYYKNTKYAFSDSSKTDISAVKFTAETSPLDQSMILIQNSVGGTVTEGTPEFTVNLSNTSLSATAKGEAKVAEGNLTYKVTDVELQSVTVNGVGSASDTVPEGWKAASGLTVDTSDMELPGVMPAAGEETVILKGSDKITFSDENISDSDNKYGKNPDQFTEEDKTKEAVVIAGKQDKGVAANAEGSLVYKVGTKDVDSVSLGTVQWESSATLLDASDKKVYNFAGVTALAGNFEMNYEKPEDVAAKQSMTLLKANETLKDIAKEETKTYEYPKEPVSGVTVKGVITGKLAAKDKAVTFTVDSNKASSLTFGKVEWTGDTPLLDHSKTLKNVSFNDAIVDTSNIDFYKEMYIEADQTTTLVSGFGGEAKVTPASTKYMVGTAFEGESETKLEGGNLILRTKTAAGVSEQTHKAVMGVEATMGLLASGIGHLDKVLDGFGNVSNAGSDGASTSASIGGGKDRYETGSHVNINSWSAAVGVGARKETKKGTLQYGIFGEYGKGSYTMHSDVGRSDGDAHYAGGGLLAKWTNKHDVYTEASFRLGRVSDSANDLLRDGAGNAYGYDIHATYYGAHIGLGKVFNFKGGKSLDVYGKFFYTKRDGAEFDAKQHYNLDSVNSSVLRIGARYGTTDKKWNWYGGLAYEYEFDGEAKGTVNGTEIRAASIKGSSVRGEFGMRMDATKDNPWRTDISIYGYGGKHRGFGGSVNVAYTF